ncbi:MAG: peptide chain release factor N(5)-glutamine methyltransferase [Lachnospiraceae bacterium]|nr:peptide chain release factor N(5)-glutamine methyltransferase [Lachnospiraceae bacterium]
MTYSVCYQDAKKRLEEAGIADAESDTRLLMMYITGKDRGFIFAHGEDEMGEDDVAAFEAAIEQRLSHIPVQHITHVADFMGLEFKTSEGVLIPRIDTEFLVEEAMRFIPDGARVLDMCTGSGCILLSIMKYKNDIEGTAVDISDAALELTKANADKLGLSPTIIKSNLFENIEGKFDYIISNPPYIRKSDIPGLMEEVREHDPHLALDGGDDGLDFYRILAKESKDYLISEGMILVEIGYDQGSDVKAIFEAEGYIDVTVLSDYAGNERVVRCSKNWKTP